MNLFPFLNTSELSELPEAPPLPCTLPSLPFWCWLASAS